MRFSGPAARLVHFLFAIRLREIANNVITEMMRSNQSNFSAGTASSALSSGYSSGSSGSLVSELHRRFSSMQGTTHRSSTPTLRTLSGTEAALIPHKG